jgi:hypothetical protein
MTLKICVREVPVSNIGQITVYTRYFVVLLKLSST